MVTSAGSARAQNVSADTVTANGTPDRWGHSSCQATLAELSDGNNANPGVCFLGPLDPSYQITFAFSPEFDEFMTGIEIWANAGNSMSDNELRRLDVEVDYFDPDSATTQTLFLNDVNIGDTTTFNDPKFVSFGGLGLFQVSAVRIDDMVGRSSDARVVFREVQGVFTTSTVEPEIGVSSSTNGAVNDGETDGQGTQTSGVTQSVTYTISNTGFDNLNVGTPTTSNESNLASAVVIGALGATELAPGESTTFTVTYTPIAGGAFGFDLDVPSNDGDESIYDIALSGTANDAPSVTLTAPPSPPAGPFAVTATFSEPVSDMDLSDFEVTNGVASGFANPEPGVYTILVTPADTSLPVSVVVPNGAATDSDGVPNNASNALGFFVVNAPSDADLEAIARIVEDEALRDLRNSIAVNQRAVRSARDRHAAFLRCRRGNNDLLGTLPDQAQNAGCPEVRGLSVEPVFDGKFTAVEKSVTGNGSFLSERQNIDGTERRLVFGELSFNSYEDGDRSMALFGRVAWEKLVSDDVLRGLFVGINAVESDIDDAFSGTRMGYGLTAGAYFIDQIDEGLYWDGYLSVGVGRNDLDIGNGTLNVEGDYDTTSFEVGVAVTGERSFERFDLYPELSLVYGMTSVGDAEIVSRSETDTTRDTLSVNDVALGILRFRPEFVFPGTTDSLGNARSSLSLAPSLLCESARAASTETDCGGGLEVEWSSFARDGLGSFSVRAGREVVGGAERDQLSLFFEKSF